MESSNIGILTLPFEPNYGWMLQLWASYNFLLQEGYNPLVLDRRWNDPSPSKLKDLKRWMYYNLFCEEFSRFFSSEFWRTTHLRSSKAVAAACGGVDTVIVGSDQVWRIENTRGADLNFFLDFLEGIAGKKRIAYAASFGNDQWAGTAEETAKVSSLLKGFDLVSVREQSGVQMCRDLFGVEAIHVLDPTMLLDADVYRQNLHLRERPAKTVTTYLLDNSAQKQAVVQTVAGTYGLAVTDLYPKKRGKFSVYKPIHFWLESILNADKVIVDSFHGMAFSILFNKQFVVIGNEKRGMARFQSLLGELGIEERLVNGDMSSATALFEKQIDYVAVNARLDALRKESAALLLEALKK